MTLEKDDSKFRGWMKRMLSMDKQVEGALKSIILPFFFVGDDSAQAARWVSEGASEGEVWRPLTETYSKRKLRKFRGYPGNGSKVLIASGRLFNANIGRPDEAGDFNSLIQGNTLFVRIGTTYAKFVTRQRDFVKFSDATYVEAKSEVKKYFDEKVRP